MAIGTPVYTPKLPYLFAMMFALGILFLDQKYDYFAPIKNTKTYLFAETKALTNKLLISSNNFFDCGNYWALFRQPYTKTAWALQQYRSLTI